MEQKAVIGYLSIMSRRWGNNIPQFGQGLEKRLFLTGQHAEIPVIRGHAKGGKTAMGGHEFHQHGVVAGKQMPGAEIGKFRHPAFCIRQQGGNRMGHRFRGAGVQKRENIIG